MITANVDLRMAVVILAVNPLNSNGAVVMWVVTGLEGHLTCCVVQWVVTGGI